MWSSIVTGVQVAHPCQKCLKGISLASRNNKGSDSRLSWGNPHKDDKDRCREGDHFMGMAKIHLFTLLRGTKLKTTN